MDKCQLLVTFPPFCLSQAACEKTVSVMHHVIKRTITYAHGKMFMFYFVVTTIIIIIIIIVCSL